MGGAFGRIKHLHEDLELTFSELKSIISQFKNGNQTIYEKFDGQNLLVTVKDGIIKVARNKGSLMNPYSLIQLQALFSEHKEHVKASFSDAMLALENFLETQNQDFFQNGKVFLNCEIINPLTRNQIDYGDDKLIIITGAVMTDGLGNIISNLSVDSIDWLFNDLDSIISLDWKISKYTQLEYNVNDLVDSTIQEINQFMEINELNDSNTINSFLEKVIFKVIDKFRLTNSQKNSLKNRWVYGDKSLRLNSVNYGMTSSELSLYEKSTLAYDLVNLMNDYTKIIQNFGNSLLKSIAANNQRMTNIQNLLNIYVASLEFVRATEFNVEKHLLSIKNMGGIQNILNIEGVVFYYHDSIYKLTGLFQPMNQICGYLKYKK